MLYVSCILFNLALEKAIKDLEIETKGTVYNKTNQTLAYADNNSNSREINR